MGDVKKENASLLMLECDDNVLGRDDKLGSKRWEAKLRRNAKSREKRGTSQGRRSEELGEGRRAFRGRETHEYDAELDDFEMGPEREVRHQAIFKIKCMPHIVKTLQGQKTTRWVNYFLPFNPPLPRGICARGAATG